VNLRIVVLLFCQVNTRQVACPSQTALFNGELKKKNKCRYSMNNDKKLGKREIKKYIKNSYQKCITKARKN
jgi:hypothetical protein